YACSSTSETPSARSATSRRSRCELGRLRTAKTGRFPRRPVPPTTSPAPGGGARGGRPVSGFVTPELEQQAISWRRHLHSHPELSFQEVETAAFVEETLRSFDGLELERPTRTSVVARLRCARPWTRFRSTRPRGSSSPRAGPGSCTRAATTRTRPCCSRRRARWPPGV